MIRGYVLAALLIGSSLNVAVAQEAPNSQTLDEQMQRVQSGQPAVPGTWNQGQSYAPAAGQPSIQPQTPVAQPASAPVAPVDYYAAKPMVAPNGEVFDSRGGDAIPALPLEIRTVGNVRYITGGVGDEEKAQLAMVENDYNVRILIAGRAGAFISGAMLRIMDASGNIVLSTDGAGPYLYAAMAPGTYTLEVTAPEGGIRTGKFTAPASGFVKPTMRFTEY